MEESLLTKFQNTLINVSFHLGPTCRLDIKLSSVNSALTI